MVEMCGMDLGLKPLLYDIRESKVQRGEADKNGDRLQVARF